MDTDLKTIAYLVMNCSGLLALSIITGVLLYKFTAEEKDVAIKKKLWPRFPIRVRLIETPILAIGAIWLSTKLAPTLFAPWSFLGLGGQMAFLLLYTASFSAAITGYRTKRETIIHNRITPKAKLILLSLIILITIHFIFHNWWLEAQ